MAGTSSGERSTHPTATLTFSEVIVKSKKDRANPTSSTWKLWMKSRSRSRSSENHHSPSIAFHHAGRGGFFPGGRGGPGFRLAG